MKYGKGSNKNGKHKKESPNIIANNNVNFEF